MKPETIQALVEASRPRPDILASLHDLERNPAFLLSTGINEVDSLLKGGIPRGAITLVVGPPSSGRTTLMLSTLRQATAGGEVCALVDASDTFDAASAESAGVDLDQILWVRCRENPMHALTATEMVLQGGGFGLVVLDLGSITERIEHEIPPPSWFRFRRAIENTPTSLLVIGPATLSASCAAVILETTSGKAFWAAEKQSYPLASPLLGLELKIKQRKPYPNAESQPISACLGYIIPD